MVETPIYASEHLLCLTLRDTIASHSPGSLKKRAMRADERIRIGLLADRQHFSQAQVTPRDPEYILVRL